MTTERDVQGTSKPVSHRRGSEALTTYALVKALARRPATADLAPHVEEMRRALSRTGTAKPKPAPPPAAPPDPAELSEPSPVTSPLPPSSKE